MSNILITGASGFVGKQLIEKILKSHPDAKIWNLGRTPVDGTIFLDLQQQSDIGKCDINFDTIIHTLAVVGEPKNADVFSMDDVNVGVTKSLLKYVIVHPNTRFVYLSSIIIYDNSNISPVKETDNLSYTYTHYSFTKGIAEEYVRYVQAKYNLNIAILRFSNLYGPGQEYRNSIYLIAEKIVQAIEEQKIVLRNQYTRRDWLYITDAVDAIDCVMNQSHITGIYNIGSGYSVSVGEIGAMIGDIFGISYSSLDIPVTGPQNFFADITRITTDTTWRPQVNILEGIQNQVKYIQNQYDNLHS